MNPREEGSRLRIGRWEVGAWDAAIVLASLAMFALILSTKGVVSYVHTLDLSFDLDAMWRSAHGEVPHLDFHSPVGQAFYWPFMLLSTFDDVSMATMLKANAVIGFVVLALGTVALRTRLSGALYFIALFVIVITAIAPRDYGKDFDVLSHLALYNRWGWSYLVLATLIFLLPPEGDAEQERRDDFIAGAIGGVALAYLALLKLTYFVGGAGLLVFAVLLRLSRLKLALISLAAFALIIVATELAFHNLGAYWSDILDAVYANVGHDPVRGWRIKKHLIEGAAYGVIIAITFWLAYPTPSVMRWIETWWRELLVTAVIIGGGALLASQNHPRRECPLFLAAMIVAAELSRRKVAALPPIEAQSIARVARVVLIFGVVGYFALLDTASVVTQAIVASSDRACGLTHLKGTPGEDLLLPPTAFTEEARARGITENCAAKDNIQLSKHDSDILVFHAERLTEGYDLVKLHARKDDVVMTLDFANPFPALLRAPSSPPGALIWWDRKRTFSLDRHPDAARLIGGTDLIMVAYTGDKSPTEPAPPSTFASGWGAWNMADLSTRPMWRIYGPMIERDFERVAQGKFWDLWRARKQR